ncbi:MAG: methionine--tRNA ligase mes1 [Marteilia pararefringens]
MVAALSVTKPLRLPTSCASVKNTTRTLENKRNILITAALPYVNNVPHLGNIIGCVLSADIYSRYCSARGYNVLFISGTDEYGTTTEVKAALSNKSCKEICTYYSKIHREIYDYFGIEFSYFGRTSTDFQTKITHEIFTDSFNNNYMTKNDELEMYCTKCQKSLADRFLVGRCPKCESDGARGDQCDACLHLMNKFDLIDPKCAICNSQPDKKETSHIYFEVQKLVQDVKQAHASNNSEKKWSQTALDIYNDLIRHYAGSNRCISRTLKWGTPVPEIAGLKDKVFYVWYDAPIGYISMTANHLPEFWEDWWKVDDKKPKVEYVQFMAKDNVPFHSIIFPATLLATKKPWKLVDSINGINYLRFEGQKFSKSKNIGIFGDTVQNIQGLNIEMLRLYLAYIRPESKDSDYKWSEYFEFYENIMLSNFGNLVNRVLSFCFKNFQSDIPKFEVLCHTENSSQQNFINNSSRIYNNFLEAFENQRISKALRFLIELSSVGNAFFSETQPWSAIKKDINDKEMHNNLSLLCSLIFLLSSMLKPYAPKLSETIQNFFESEDASPKYALPDAFQVIDFTEFKLRQPTILLPRIAKEQREDLMSQFEKMSIDKST